MELVILDERMLEFERFTDFDSLVWNERYQEPGDFQMRIYGIETAYRYFRKDMLVGVSNSDYVMQVTNIDTEVDSLGNEVVTVVGKTLEEIYKYRPAVPKISSIFAMEAEQPDGWEWGFKDEEWGTIDPFNTIVMEVMNYVDIHHYQRPELAWLTLPFQYYKYDNVPGEDGFVSTSRLQRHYVVDRGATVDDVLADMLPEAQMGIATLRPRPESPLWRSHEEGFKKDEHRPGMIVFYRPRRLASPITFDYLMEDYTSESTQLSSDYANVIFQATEDTVYAAGEGWQYGMPKSGDEWEEEQGFLTDFPLGGGLRRRVSLTEKEYFDLTQDEVARGRRSYIEKLFDGYSQTNTYSVETSGKFPYDQKRFAIADASPHAFFLGDIVRLNLKEEKQIDVQVKEYIRTQDADGYKEYPTFVPARELGEWRNPIYEQYSKSSSELYNWN